MTRDANASYVRGVADGDEDPGGEQLVHQPNVFVGAADRERDDAGAVGGRAWSDHFDIEGIEPGDQMIGQRVNVRGDVLLSKLFDQLDGCRQPYCAGVVGGAPMLKAAGAVYITEITVRKNAWRLKILAPAARRGLNRKISCERRVEARQSVARERISASR